MLRSHIKIGILLVALISTSGCTDSVQSSDVSTEIGQTVEPSREAVVTSAWDCESKEDGLGEKFVCQSSADDEYGNIWFLTLMCTSDQRSLHSIYGMNPSANSITWDNKGTKKVMVRIDSEPIQSWKASPKGNEAFAFVDFEGEGLNETKSTWNFLKKIASAKTLGFKLLDSEGVVRSAKFNVGDSVPIAANFSARGC
jgi:hypothetical protein